MHFLLKGFPVTFNIKQNILKNIFCLFHLEIVQNSAFLVAFVRYAKNNNR